MTRLIRAAIDTAALRANLARIKAVAPTSRVIAVVKANGYGHGAVTVVRPLFVPGKLPQPQWRSSPGIPVGAH